MTFFINVTVQRTGVYRAIACLRACGTPRSGELGNGGGLCNHYC